MFLMTIMNMDNGNTVDVDIDVGKLDLNLNCPSCQERLVSAVRDAMNEHVETGGNDPDDDPVLDRVQEELERKQRPSLTPEQLAELLEVLTIAIDRL